jgi:hypothetical protein
MMDLDWAGCPNCGREVPIVGGLLGVHIVPRAQARWPKMAEECPRSGTPLKAPESQEPLLGEM